MTAWTAVMVVVLGCAAVAALVRRDEERNADPSTGRDRSPLAAAAWLLTVAALLSAAARVLIIY